MRTAAVPVLGTRAVSRRFEEKDIRPRCAFCGNDIGFRGTHGRDRTKLRQIIANVYVNGLWNRVEHFHASCYDEAGQPYGPVQ